MPAPDMGPRRDPLVQDFTDLASADIRVQSSSGAVEPERIIPPSDKDWSSHAEVRSPEMPSGGPARPSYTDAALGYDKNRNAVGGFGE